MFFEYAAPFQKSSRVTKRGLPALGVLENRQRSIGRGRPRAFKSLLKELTRIRELGADLNKNDQRALRRLILHDDARIWRPAADLDGNAQGQDLRKERAQGTVTQGQFFTLLERLGLVSSQDIPALLSSLGHGSQNLTGRIRRLLKSLDARIVVGHCVLALRDDRADAITLIDFLAEMGADARFARPELEQRLESWGCPLDERGALIFALSQIPEGDAAASMSACLNHKDAA